jgi:uncharacterized membrane protein
LSDKTPIEKIYTAFFEEAFSADLGVALLWLAASILVIFDPVLKESPLRVVLTLPVILFLPGYCLIAALFCKEDDIDLIERIALSFGLSIAIVPLIGLVLNFTPWGIRLDPIVISLTLFTVVIILIAQYRRTLLLPGQRFRFPFSEIVNAVRNSFYTQERSRVDRILTVVLIFLILIAVVTTIYVIAVPKEGERFTEFFILGEQQKASNYPNRIMVGEQYPLYIGVGNYEYRPVNYTVRTYGMLIEFDNTTNTSRIISMDPLWQQSLTVAHNDTATIPYNLSVETSRYNRIEFLLFNETVPGPDVSSGDLMNVSYRDLHLWVNVQDMEFQEPALNPNVIVFSNVTVIPNLTVIPNVTTNTTSKIVVTTFVIPIPQITKTAADDPWVENFHMETYRYDIPECIMKQVFPDIVNDPNYGIQSAHPKLVGLSAEQWNAFHSDWETWNTTGLSQTFNVSKCQNVPISENTTWSAWDIAYVGARIIPRNGNPSDYTIIITLGAEGKSGAQIITNKTLTMDQPITIESWVPIRRSEIDTLRNPSINYNKLTND